MNDDSLRTRIAAVIESIRIQRDGDAARMADAVIAELGLRQETTYAWNNGRTHATGIRYVTDWTRG